MPEQKNPQYAVLDQLVKLHEQLRKRVARQRTALEDSEAQLDALSKQIDSLK